MLINNTKGMSVNVQDKTRPSRASRVHEALAASKSLQAEWHCAISRAEVLIGRTVNVQEWGYHVADAALNIVQDVLQWSDIAVYHATQSFVIR
jgi:hypothetical protein